MIIWRPSIFVWKDSTTASSCKSSFTRLSTSIPICWRAISRPRKRSVILALSPSSEKANQAAEFYLIVAFICTRTEFNFLNLDNFLLFLLFLRRLALFIEEFAVIHYTTNRRLGVRADHGLLRLLLLSPELLSDSQYQAARLPDLLSELPGREFRH